MQGQEQLNNDIGAQDYKTQLGAYDEMYASEDKVLPYWASFISALEKMGGEELERRRRDTQRLLRENGVTYNVYGDEHNLARPWQLDPIPLLISNEEWSVIEAGLVQRAILFDLILKDIYGKQSLLKKGLLPFELVYGHPGFLRPCVGTFQQLQRQLIIYSANLARGPNGRMWVVDDRTQAPSGTGYALENRTVMTRVLPDLFRESQVQRLSGYFRALHQGLAALAPHNRDNPRIVILTPGPLNETYFEHAYLSSYLGYTLVQGDDLTVRDGKVWLKSLEGLQSVDVILRRVDDSYCDPLELRSDSRLGIAGLLECVRRGNVAIANPLGSSVLENSGLLAFLPRLARHFLDQELILPSVATWWCGQPHERDFVLQNMDRLVIKQIYRGKADHTIFGNSLSQKDQNKLRDKIRAKPHLFVGQEQISFSTVPALIDGHIEPRYALFRNFTVASDHDYQAMPGGLTRVARKKDNFIVSTQAGGFSKDTWILTPEPEKHLSLWSGTGRNQLIEAISEPLPSRVADNLFWVGRNLERAETSTRLLRCILQTLQETLEFRDSGDIACLTVLLRSLTHVTGSYPGFTECPQQLLNHPQEELLSLAQDRQRSGSLAMAIQGFSQAAFSIRDLWSQDTWRSIDTIQRQWHHNVIDRSINVEQLQDHLDELITGIVAFTGLTTESMTRETGWLILDSGRRLEKAISLISLLRATMVPRHDEALLSQVLEAVLYSNDSLNIYQRRYRSYIQYPMVLELLLLDETHPRSVVFQLKQLYEHVQELPRETRKGKLSDEERLLLEAYSDLRLVKLADLIRINENDSIYYQLEQLLSNIAGLLWQAADCIAQTYFSHAHGPQEMTPMLIEDEL